MNAWFWIAAVVIPLAAYFYLTPREAITFAICGAAAWVVSYLL